MAGQTGTLSRGNQGRARIGSSKLNRLQKLRKAQVDLQADRDGGNMTQLRDRAPVTFGRQGQFVIPDFAGQYQARGYPVRDAVQDAEMFAE